MDTIVSAATLKGNSGIPFPEFEEEVEVVGGTAVVVVEAAVVVVAAAAVVVVEAGPEPSTVTVPFM